MGQIASLWRHPIKSHGREEVTSVTLSPGRTMPGDRVWAVAHEAAKADGTAWAPCQNFTIGAKAPGLQGIRTVTHDDGTLTLAHPDLGTLVFDPETEGDRLIDWTKPLIPANRAQSARVMRVPDRGMTDTDYPSISLLNLASHRAVEEAAGQPLSPLRWRGNVLIDGLEPWEEAGWIGREVTLGSARLLIREPIVRCNATRASDAGVIDCDTLAILNTRFGHQTFGVYAEVIEGGAIAPGDRVTA